jgi:hypothetical protein
LPTNSSQRDPSACRSFSGSSRLRALRLQRRQFAPQAADLFEARGHVAQERGNSEDRARIVMERQDREFERDLPLICRSSLWRAGTASTSPAPYRLPSFMTCS